MDPGTDRGLNVGVEEPQEEESRSSEVIKRGALSAEMAQKQWHPNINENTLHPDSALKETKDLEKWLIPALEQKNYKVNLKDHFVPESKALFKESWRLVKKIVASLKGLTLATSGQLGLKNKKKDSNGFVEDCTFQRQLQ